MVTHRMIPTLPLAMENIAIGMHRKSSYGRLQSSSEEDQRTKPRLLTLLTVEMVKTQYWKTGKPIKFYPIQTYGSKDINDNPVTNFNENGDPHELMVFVLDGTLHHVNRTAGIRELIPDWLSTATGPYREEDREKSLPDFYSLGGHYVYANGEIEKSNLQICSGPLNVLSTDCLDEVNVWV